MKSVNIRDVEPTVLASLKRPAKSHHRSLQGELRSILEQAARLAPPEEDESEMDLVTVSTHARSSWNRDEIYGDQGR